MIATVCKSISYTDAASFGFTPIILHLVAVLMNRYANNCAVPAYSHLHSPAYSEHKSWLNFAFRKCAYVCFRQVWSCTANQMKNCTWNTSARSIRIKVVNYCVLRIYSIQSSSSHPATTKKNEITKNRDSLSQCADYLFILKIRNHLKQRPFDAVLLQKCNVLNFDRMEDITNENILIFICNPGWLVGWLAWEEKFPANKKGILHRQ